MCSIKYLRGLKLNFFIRFLLSVSHVFLPASIRVFTVVPNPILRVDSFSIVMRSCLN
jgi:hypothetical protein